MLLRHVGLRRDVGVQNALHLRQSGQQAGAIVLARLDNLRQVALCNAVHVLPHLGRIGAQLAHQRSVEQQRTCHARDEHGQHQPIADLVGQVCLLVGRL